MQSGSGAGCMHQNETENKKPFLGFQYNQGNMELLQPSCFTLLCSIHRVCVSVLFYHGPPICFLQFAIFSQVDYSTTRLGGFTLHQHHPCWSFTGLLRKLKENGVYICSGSKWSGMWRLPKHQSCCVHSCCVGGPKRTRCMKPYCQVHFKPVISICGFQTSRSLWLLSSIAQGHKNLKS